MQGATYPFFYKRSGKHFWFPLFHLSLFPFHGSCTFLPFPGENHQLHSCRMDRQFSLLPHLSLSSHIHTFQLLSFPSATFIRAYQNSAKNSRFSDFLICVFEYSGIWKLSSPSPSQKPKQKQSTTNFLLPFSFPILSHVHLVQRKDCLPLTVANPWHKRL